MSVADLGPSGIDCDVHCPSPTLAEFGPFLDAQWRDTLEHRHYRRPLGPSYTYPAWSAMLAPDAPLTLDRLRADVLSRSELAVLQCYAGLEGETHPYLVRSLMRAINTWMSAEWLDREPRLLGSVVVAPQDTEGSVAEIQRLAGDERFVQILVPGRAWEPYGAHRYWPIWAAAADAGLAVAITYGGTSGSAPTPNGWSYSVFEDYAAYHQVIAAHVSSLTASGIFQKLPHLKVVIVESGWTWLPGLMWRMDAEWKAVRREVPWLSEPPSAYIHRHMRLTTAPSDVAGGASAVRQVFDELHSPDVLMFGSDYPRSPEPGGADVLEVLDADERRKVMHDNACDTYGLRDKQSRSRTGEAGASASARSVA